VILRNHSGRRGLWSVFRALLVGLVLVAQASTALAVDRAESLVADLAEPALRGPARDRLIRLGVRAVPALTHALESPSVDVRVAACTALGRLNTPQAAGPLERAATDTDNRVRATAAVALGQLGCSASRGVLVRLLDDPSPRVKGAAAYGLGLLGDSRSAKRIATLLTEKDPSTRAMAAKALELVRSRLTARHLYDALRNDPDGVVRANTAAALGAMSAPEATGALVAGLSDPSPVAADACYYALVRISNRDFGGGPGSSPKSRRGAQEKWFKWYAGNYAEMGLFDGEEPILSAQPVQRVAAIPPTPPKADVPLSSSPEDTHAAVAATLPQPKRIARTRPKTTLKDGLRDNGDTPVVFSPTPGGKQPSRGVLKRLVDSLDNVFVRHRSDEPSGHETAASNRTSRRKRSQAPRVAVAATRPASVGHDAVRQAPLPYPTVKGSSDANQRAGMLLAVGAAHYAGGRYDKAATCYRRAAVLDPSLRGVHFSLGLAYQKLGRGDEAQAAYRKAVAADPSDGSSLNNLAVLLVKNGQCDKAEPILRRVVALDPERASAHFNLGEALRMQGKLQEAVEQYERVLSGGAGGGGVERVVVEARIAECRRFAERKNSLSAQRAAASRSRGQTSAAGRPTGATGPRKKAAASRRKTSGRTAEPPQEPVRREDNPIADAPWYQEVRALLRAKDAVKRNPGDAAARVTLARAYFRNGRRDLAVEEMEEAVRLAPNEGTYKVLRDIYADR